MPDIVSRIKVLILGDARGLTAATTAADRSFATTARNIAGGLVVLGGIKKGFDFLGDATQEADRLGDATTRLELQLGPLSARVTDTADAFEGIGQSRQDILELSANFADLATKAGISDEVIADNAESVAAMAAAAALLGDQDAGAVVDAIGKAAAGNNRPLADLGVFLDEASVQARALQDSGKDLPEQLTATEIATARLALIMEQLAPKLTEVTEGEADLEQKQSELQAKFETFTGKVGEALEGPLEDLLQFTIDEIDSVDNAIDGFEMLGDAIVGFGRTALGPLGNVRDVLEDIVNLFSRGTGAFDQADIGAAGGRRSESNTVRDQQDFDERNGGTRTVNNRIGGP